MIKLEMTLAESTPRKGRLLSKKHKLIERCRPQQAIRTTTNTLEKCTKAPQEKGTAHVLLAAEQRSGSMHH